MKPEEYYIEKKWPFKWPTTIQESLKAFEEEKGKIKYDNPKHDSKDNNEQLKLEL